MGDHVRGHAGGGENATMKKKAQPEPEIDPRNSTSPDLGRKAFIGLTAGALAAGGTIPPLLADVELGKPHPPLVAEDDPAITVERPLLPVLAGRLDAYAAYPRIPSSSVPTQPGIVLVQHIWGIDAQIRDTVRRLAKQGYVVVAPNLYAGLGAPSGDGATDHTPFLTYASKLSDVVIDRDVLAAATWIRTRENAGPLQRPPKIGIMGFCMGGGLALRAATETSAFDALVVFYGSVRQGEGDSKTPISAAQLAYTDQLHIPFMGQFGARDTSIVPDDVRAMQKRLHVPNDIKIYGEAGHAFFDDTRDRYVASAANDAWQRTLRWFKTYLK